MDVPVSQHPVGPDAATLADIASFDTEGEGSLASDDGGSTFSSDFPEYIGMTHTGPFTASTANAIAGPSTARTKVRPSGKRPRESRHWLDTPIKKTRHNNTADGTDVQPIYIHSGTEADNEDDEAEAAVADDMVL